MSIKLLIGYYTGYNFVNVSILWNISDCLENRNLDTALWSWFNLCYFFSNSSL